MKDAGGAGGYLDLQEANHAASVASDRSRIGVHRSGCKSNCSAIEYDNVHSAWAGVAACGLPRLRPMPHLRAAGFADAIADHRLANMDATASVALYDDLLAHEADDPR